MLLLRNLHPHHKLVFFPIIPWLVSLIYALNTREKWLGEEKPR